MSSYAVYRSDGKIGNKYTTGKLYHIYRPLLIDAKFTTSWANLTVTKTSLTIVCDNEFLETAVYPVTIDPSFGYTTIGGSSATSWNLKTSACKFSLSEDGTVTSVTAYIGVDNEANLGIYDSTPSSRLSMGTPREIDASMEWEAFPQEVELSAGTYWLAMGAGSVTGNDLNIRYDSGDTGQYLRHGNNYFPATWSGGSSEDSIVSIYCNYTTDGPSHTDAELPETVNLSASLETQKDMYNLFSETVTVSSSCGVVKSLTRVNGETAGVSADYLSVKTLTRTAGESSVVTSVFESSKGITQVLAELSETVSVSASLLVQKAIYVLASGTVDVSAVLDTVKHLGATFIELLETLPFTAYLEVLLPEIPLTVEVVVVIAFLALAIAVSAFAYVATRERD